jgi:hypothetical protein
LEVARSAAFFRRDDMVQHPTLIRSALADVVCGMLNGGVLVLLSVTGVEIARLHFSDPAFFPAIGGVAVANTISSDPNAIGGKVAKASLRDPDDNEILVCDVSLVGDGGMIELSTLTVAAGQEVNISALNYVAVP